MSGKRKNGKPIKNKRAKQPSVWRGKLLWGIIAIISVLGLFSICTNSYNLQEDWQLLRESNNVFSGIFGANAISFSNPIGVFGVISGNFLITLFGRIFSFIGICLLILISFHALVYPEKVKVRSYSILLFIIAFCLQVILVSGEEFYAFNSGLLPWGFWYLLKSLFSVLGGRIAVLGIAILSVILIVGHKAVRQKFAEAWEAHLRRLEKRKLKSASAQTISLTNSEGPSITDHAQRQTQDIQPKPAPEFVPSAQPEPQPKFTAHNKTKSASASIKNPVSEDNGEQEYQIPSVEEFLVSPVKLSRKDRDEIENQIKNTSKILMEKLAEFGIEAEVINVNIGPIITQYELRPAPGVKVSRFTSLADDLALAIKAKSIRVQAPIPGKGLIGIEIPNLTRDTIYLRDILLSPEMEAAESKLAFGLGKEISGKPVVTDLAKMPHLLIAGATGSGKSVCINTIIMSLLLRTKPDDLRLILIDPKRVELAGYNGIPHLIGSVVTDAETALETMYWSVREMERRYELLQEMKVRDIVSFNEKVAETGELEKLPYIIIIIDEFADLIMTSGKDIELPITRLAQMARAVGMHLILATQRPSIKVITGIIKANFPARIAFQVSSKVDSRVILDMIGAERLLGNGDMLFIPPGKAVPERIHGAFVSDAEIESVCNYLRKQPRPREEIIVDRTPKEEMDFLDYDDELFPEAARLVVASNMASVSMLQRHFKIGYARAGRLIDMLEKAHIVGPHLGSKSRDVLATMEDLQAWGLINED